MKVKSNILTKTQVIKTLNKIKLNVYRQTQEYKNKIAEWDKNHPQEPAKDQPKPTTEPTKPTQDATSFTEAPSDSPKAEQH